MALQPEAGREATECRFDFELFFSLVVCYLAVALSVCACRGYTCHERLANTWSLLYKKGFKTKRFFFNNLATIKKLNILLWKWDTQKQELHYRSWQMFEGFLCFPHNFLMTCKSPVWLGQSLSVHFPFFVCLRGFLGIFSHWSPLALTEMASLCLQAFLDMMWCDAEFNY